jgi:hypothetical protein
MGLYLTIPDVVDSEPLLSLAPGHDSVTFFVTMDVDETALRLMRFSQEGQHIPLVVLTTDSQIIALDSVYVTDAAVGGQPPIAHLTFAAQAVRFV